MDGADDFNRDPTKGLEFLQRRHLLPEKLDPQSVACFLIYAAAWTRKSLEIFWETIMNFMFRFFVGFLTSNFQDMNLDPAFQLFLETVGLPGESQKILLGEIL
uniref:SEC7 domain-containing protein n=1 Tax=Opuntia streptacantha TaxID=393608 RepID=A0A7C9EIE9_OPUST